MPATIKRRRSVLLAASPRGVRCNWSFTHQLLECLACQALDEPAGPVDAGTVDPARAGLEDQGVQESFVDRVACSGDFAFLLGDLDKIGIHSIVRQAGGMREKIADESKLKSRTH